MQQDYLNPFRSRAGAIYRIKYMTRRYGHNAILKVMPKTELVTKTQWA